SAGFCKECRDDTDCAKAHPDRPLCKNALCVAKPQCVKNEDCGAGQKCSAEGKCVAECGADQDCGEGKKCLSGRCSAEESCLADAVKKYLAGLGIDFRRLKAVSYGKERPADPGHDEAAWSRNRRVELSTEQ